MRHVVLVWTLVVGGGCSSSNDEARSSDPSSTATANPNPTPNPTPDDEDDDGLTDAERTALGDEASKNPWLADSPSVMGHFDSSRRASTYLAGPTTDDLVVDVRDFENLSGFDVGTSPWHVISSERYGSSGIRTVWGTGLRYAYKFVVDGARFELADVFILNERLTSIPWNMVALADGRVVFPDIDGFDAVPPGDPCRTEQPSLVALRDQDSDPMSPIECVGVIELDVVTVRSACGVGPAAEYVAGSGSSLVATFSGELVTVVELQDEAETAIYAVAVTNDLSEIVSCGRVADTPSTNASAVEPAGENTSAFYFATETSVVKLYYDGALGLFTRAWERPLPIRRRTGTTPTLLDASNGDKLLVLVDGACAVTNVLNGLIVCDDAAEPSQLIAVRREDDTGGQPDVLRADLPATIRTVENSPAVRGDRVVIANYSGYVPNGLLVPPGGEKPDGGPGTFGVSPDAVEDFAVGVAVLRYTPDRQTFEVEWIEATYQMSGVPLISAGANLVYGTGAEVSTGMTYLYGFLLEADARGPAGSLVLRRELGTAPFRESRRDVAGNNVFPIASYRFDEGELYDSGNNTLLNTDRSLFMTGGRALVRVRARPKP